MTVTEIKSIICPNCKKLISSDEPVCPYCGISKPGSKRFKLFGIKGKISSGEIVSYIIYVNIIMYVISIIIVPSNGNLFALMSPSNSSLMLLGASGTIPIDNLNGRWWTLLSANYLHSGILHIFFNMVALKQIGGLVLREFGANRLIIIYTGGGIIGFFVSYLAGINFTIGASAAVSSLIGAVLYYGKSRGGVYGKAVFKEVSGWVIGLALFGLLIPGINNWAHGGGIIAGIIISFIVGYSEKRRENILHVAIASASIIATLAVLSWAILTTLLYLNF